MTTRFRFTLALLLTLPVAALAQTPGVGIGTTAPDVSAALDIVSSDKGALLPRVADATTIATPATGLLVFQTGGTPGFYYNSGTPAAPSWQQLATASGAAVTATNGLTKTGAAIGLGGTLTQATTIDQGSNDLLLTGTGNVGIGQAAPTARLDVASSLRVSSTTATGGAQLSQPNTMGAVSSLNGQSFTLPVGTTIRAIDVFVFSGGGTFSVYKGAPGASASLASQPVTYTPGYGATTVVLATPIVVTSPGVYSFTAGGSYFVSFSPNVYAGGQAYDGTVARPNDDLKFNVRYDGQNEATLYAAPSGQVGIGTSAPTATLDVAGSTRLRGLTTPGVVTTDANGNLSSGTATTTFGSDFIQNQNAADQSANFRISGNGYLGGNVGIGTASPFTRLSISPGSIEPKITLFDGGSTTTYYGLGISSGQFNYHVDGTGSRHVFYAGGKNGDGTELMRIQGDGNVGIGTSSPASTLDVRTADGSARLTVGTTANTGGGIAFGNPGHGIQRGYPTLNADNNVGFYTTAGSLYLSGNGTRTDQFVLDNGGRVGIGTGTPTARQETVGDLRVTYAGSSAGTVGTGTAGGNFGNGLVNLGQSFTLNTATTITSVTLRASQTYATTLTLYAGAGSTGTALTAALPIAFTAGSPATVTLPTPLAVGAGVYTLVLATGNGVSAHNGDVYSGGVAYTGTGAQPHLDLEFTVAFSAGPAAALYAGAGSVGVNTGAPTATLDVNGSTRLRGLTTPGVVTTDASGNLSSQALPAAPTGADFIQNQTTADQAGGFRVGGNGYVAGNVGIGTSSPQGRLDVASGTVRLPGGGGGDTWFNYASDGKNYLRGTTVLGEGGSSVGIGTSSPTQKLDVAGNVNVTGTLQLNTADTDKLFYTLAGAAGSKLGHAAGWGVLNYAGPGTGGPTGYHSWLTTGAAAYAERMRLTETGLGIGTDAPTATLDVAGSTRLRGLTTAGLVVTDASGNLGSSDATTAFGASFIQNTTTPQAGSNFNVSGNGTVGGTLTADNAVVTTALTGSGADIGSVVGVGVRADGGLNIGQNTGQNILVGFEAGRVLTGSRNTMSGYRSGYNTTTGSNNTFSGVNSGASNTTGTYNTYTGLAAGLLNTTGQFNTISGYASGQGTVGGTNTGSSNVFTGAYSGFTNSTGSNNTFVGEHAGRYNDTGSSNTALGSDSGPASGSGNLTNATAVGANVALTTSNTVVLGNGANVGIGTPAPGQKLEVAGGIKFTGTGSVLTFPDGSTQAVAATTATASNGLTKTGDNIVLGGTLAANTDVALNNKSLTFSGLGKIGVGLTNPLGQLANTSVNTLGADSRGGNGESVNWATAQDGYVGQFYNGGTSSAANGVAVKIDGTTATATALDVSKGAQGTAGTSLLAVKASGNVGIGTRFPTSLLDLGSSAGAAPTDAATRKLALYNNTGGTDFYGFGVSSGSLHVFTNAAAGAAPDLTVRNGGSVGIGTTAPGQRLEVAGATAATATVNTLGLLRLSRPQTSGVKYANAFDVHLGSYGTAVNSQSQVDFRLADGATNTPDVTVLSLQGSGNVGIGTTTPAGGLQVLTGNGGVTSGGAGAVLSGAPGTNPNLELRGGSTAVTPYIDFAENNTVDYTTRLRSIGGVLNVEGTGGGGGLLFKVNGSIQATNVTFTSDARFKQNVRPLSSALSSVLALRGVRYEWNALGVQHGGTAGAPQVGLIAQEVEVLYPELVSTDAQGYKAVNYAQLTPVLIEAIKELKAENDALKAQAATAGTRAAAAQAQAATATAKAVSAETKADAATAALESLSQRLRALEAGGGQARR